jgi:hypothetical protein
MLNMRDYAGAAAALLRAAAGMMPPADRRHWASARTLEDLAGLTALWLEGKVGSRPGYPAGRGPEPETTELVPLLAGLCRAGYMTVSSQPTRPADAGGWEQRAAVQGFAGESAALRVADVALAAGMEVITTPPSARPGRGDALAVTRRRGRAVTSFGPLPSRVIGSPDSGWGLCHQEAVDALRGAWQLTIADPDWGRPGLLWQALAAVAGAIPPPVKEVA